MNSPESFGVIGDLVADDTEAMQAWINAGGWKLEELTPKITAPLILSGNGRTLVTRGGAKIVAGTPDMTMLEVSGNDCTLSVQLDGLDLAAVGINVTGARPVIEDSRLRNFRSANVMDARAININTNTGSTVRRNDIRNVHNAKAGAFSRAIAVNATTAAVGDNIITDNVISDVTGTEGDAIHVLFNDGGTVFLSARALIARNHVRNASRRFVKVQGSDTTVRDNTIRWDTATVPEAPATFINAFQSDNVTITGNDIGAGLLSSPISVTGIAGRTNKGVLIARNIVRQANDRDISGVYMEYLEDSACVDNQFFGGGHCVTIGNSINVLVDAPVGFGGLTSRQTVRGTTTNTNVVVRYAANMNAARANYVQLDGTGHKAELNFTV